MANSGEAQLKSHPVYWTLKDTHQKDMNDTEFKFENTRNLSLKLSMRMGREAFWWTRFIKWWMCSLFIHCSLKSTFIHCSLKSTFSVNNMFKLYMYQESTLTVKLELQKNNHFRVSTQTRHEKSWNDISYTLGAPEVCGSRSLCSGADVGWRSHSSPSSQVEEHQNLPQDRVGNWRTLDKRVGGAEWSPAP